MSWLSGALSGGASLIGGAISAITGKQANDREYARQQEFAQNGIRWRVEDAKAAGIHPIFAIGANTPTYSPQAAVGTDYGISSAGQNISRAIEAKATAKERAEYDALQKDLVRAQIRRTNAETQRIENAAIDDALNFAALSSQVIRRQSDQRPPAMPSAWNHNVPKGDNMFQWMPGTMKDVYHFYPGNDYSQIWEDKGWLLEKGALAAALITSLGGRADENILDGMKYFEEVSGWVPMESKLYKQLMEQRHAKTRINYGPERFRSVRDTGMHNWR